MFPLPIQEFKGRKSLIKKQNQVCSKKTAFLAASSAFTRRKGPSGGSQQLMGKKMRMRREKMTLVLASMEGSHALDQQPHGREKGLGERARSPKKHQKMLR